MRDGVAAVRGNVRKGVGRLASCLPITIGLRYVLTPGNWREPRVSLRDEGCNPRRAGSLRQQEMAVAPETGTRYECNSLNERDLNLQNRRC